MSEYKYILEPYKGQSTRHTCPCCQGHKTFTKYIDIDTGDPLHNDVGMCNRKIKCTYNYSPKEYFKDIYSNDRSYHKKFYNYKKVIKTDKVEYSTISLTDFKASLQEGKSLRELANSNSFIQFIYSTYGLEMTKNAISKYFIGTSDYWSGANIFWQIDMEGKIRTGKIMRYDSISGKRVKHIKKSLTWYHSLKHFNSFQLIQCLFGEHLLKEHNKTVCLVESEKTAIIASIHFPQYIWIATGGISNFKENMVKVLKGREVILYPDLGAYDRWRSKALEFRHITNFKLFDLLERNASENDLKEGLDLADYLLREKKIGN